MFQTAGAAYTEHTFLCLGARFSSRIFLRVTHSCLCRNLGLLPICFYPQRVRLQVGCRDAGGWSEQEGVMSKADQHVPIAVDLQHEADFANRLESQKLEIIR